jgi:mycothiol synthase
MMPYNFRHCEPHTDLPRVAQLYAEAAAADGEPNDANEVRLREQMALPGHNPAQDTWIVEVPGDPDELVGFASVWKEPGGARATLAGVVHPDWRRRSIGRILLRYTLSRARAMGATQVGAYAESRNQASTAFLREHSFLPVAAYTLMRARTGVPFNPPAWPAGFSVRSYDAVPNLPLLVQAMNSSYDGLWGHSVTSEEELGGRLREWAQDGLFLVFDAGGEVAGVCRAELSRKLSEERGQATGYIEAPGVIPFRRREGLYLPLLLTAVQYLRARQPATIELESWGDDDRTLAVYQQAGFVNVRQSVSYRLNLH